uniref:NADH dehydrogenase subunit 6 n=1 Tax=Grateloupia elliptica TaxID=118371 RepID=UPI002027C6AA|nr:NADH dehydrogenase subunit 6 [Grateloupia elliptica]UQJ72552.1 NADH dehydrogenase subunit 6 [Grateloupia elliptica]UYI31682.1 NADH dehydrogenase subunit 6 [Grateloupia elliptica]
MNIDFFLFILFSSFALVSSLLVISLKNAVHSVLFLILVFCNVAGLLLLFGAEFLSFMLLIVYVGAIAVLFLFVVMMLNIKVAPITVNSFSVLPVGVLIFLILFSQLLSIAANFDIFDLQQHNLVWVSWILEKDNITNIEVVGKVLYTHFSLLFLLSSLILLVAMIGAIVLTMHQRTDVQKQRIDTQLARNFDGAVKFITLRK